LFNAIAEEIVSEVEDIDISDVTEAFEGILDKSILTAQYVIRSIPTENLYDFSGIDFEALRARFESGQKRLTVEKLRGRLNRKLQQLIQHNPTRMNYLETFSRMIQSYSIGATGVDEVFSQPVNFVGKLQQEEQRTIAENLSEEELVIFDLLTRPDMRLTRDERERVKAAAKELLDTLKREKLVLD
jgi:type I restriction enzyme, R subunit